MPLTQILVLLLAGSSYSLPQGYLENPQVTPVAWSLLMGCVAILLVAILGFQFLNHRRKLKVMQLRTLESLARQGKIGREDIEMAFGSQNVLAKWVLVVSWVSFLVSMFYVAVSQAQRGWGDLLIPSALAAVISFAMLSVPFLLNEYQRTQQS